MFNRRRFLQGMLSASVTLPVVTQFDAFTRLTSQTQPAMPQFGTITRTERENAVIHTYIAPEGGMRVTSHIIETANQLVLVDAQYVITFANEFREYAESLGKPIERIIISHSHPDHWLGLAEFSSDIPMYAAPETLAVLNERRDMFRDGQAEEFGRQITETPVIPTLAIEVATEEIDGLTYEYEVIPETEDGFILTIRLPQLGILIAQDVIYNQAHFFTAGEFVVGGSVENWITVLTNLRDLTSAGYDTFLAGHGEPGGVELIDAAVEYLSYAREVIADAQIDTPAEYERALLEVFTHYNGLRLLRISAIQRYPEGSA